MLQFPQKQFSGGSDTLSDPTQISLDGYEWLINGRTRFDYVEPIKKPRILTNAPAGKKQGLYGVGNSLILFCGGLAYYYDLFYDVWHQINGFQMDANVNIIYAEL